MTRQNGLPRHRRAIDALRARVDSGGEDGGFMLVEVMIALTLITFIMAAVGVEFVSGLANTAHQRAIVNAGQVATTAVGDVRSLDPSDLLSGRTLTASTTERTALVAIPKVATWIGTADKMAYNNDATKTTAAVPTTATPVKPSGLSYNVFKYFECLSTPTETTNPDGTKQHNCSPAARDDSNQANSMRLIVAVVWNQRGCPSTGCAFVTATLLDTHANPTFDLNQPLPAAPVATNPGDQTVAVNDVVSLQLMVNDGTGVTPFTWSITAGSLPSGLQMNSTGLISGTVTGAAQAAASVTVKVTDAFIRESSTTFKFTVQPALRFDPIDPKSNTTAQTVTGSVTASGGAGAPFTYSDPNGTLPPGVTLTRSGTLGGQPSTAGNYTVTLTVTDSSLKRTATTTFTWTITSPPLALSNPGAQTSTNGKAVSLQMTASGGSGTYTYTATGLPTGTSINATSGLISGTPSANGTYSAMVTARDSGTTPQSVTFAWKVVTQPTVSSPGDRTNSRGATVSVNVPFTCPNSPCTFTSNNLPKGLSLGTPDYTAQTLPVTGTVQDDATLGSASVSVSVTDAAGAAGPAAANFTWTIKAKPSVSTAASTVVTGVSASPSVAITWQCPNTSCRLTLGGAVPGVGLSASPTSTADNTSATSLAVTGTSGTAYLNGTVAGSATGTGADDTSSYNTVITITDTDGAKGQEADTWTARRAPTIGSPGNVSVARNGNAGVQFYIACSTTGTASCSVSLSGAPSGIGLNNSSQTTAQNTTSATVSNGAAGTAYVTGKVASNAAVGTYNATLTITQTVNGSSITIVSYGTWTVT